jgi:hypothetical protein
VSLAAVAIGVIAGYLLYKGKDKDPVSIPLFKNRFYVALRRLSRALGCEPADAALLLFIRRGALARRRRTAARIGLRTARRRAEEAPEELLHFFIGLWPCAALAASDPLGGADVDHGRAELLRQVGEVG